MAKASPAQVSFNSGELSRALDARTDYAKYSSGCSVLENFLPTVQGPAKRRGGTRFVAETKDSSARSWLVRFEYAVEQAYILEFGDQYVRFYTWDSVTLARGRLESPPGTPVEVATPYTQAQLFNTDGTCRLRFAQSGDFLYITHPEHQPRILKRTSATTFVLELFVALGGPFKDIDPDTAVTVSASAQTGAGITLTASAAIFTAGHIGSLFYLEARNVQTVTAWEPGKVVGVGVRRRSDGKVYESLNGATTGANRPVHTHGALYDGDTGVQWEFRDPGYGYVRITAVGGGGTTATADVVDRLPLDVVGASSTTRWAHGAWSTVEGWPTDVAFFRERLWFARNQTLWASVSSGFDDFSRLNYGQVTDDMAITLTIASGTLNKIQWLIADKELVAGTAGNEFAIGEYSNGSPLGPGNVRTRNVSQYGSRAIVPVQAGVSVLFVQRAGLKVREIVYDEVAGYQSTDVTVDAEHITEGGLVDVDYAQEPDPLVWAARADGALVAMTWSTEQRVRGWHRHPIGGDGVVESVATMPAAEGDRNEVWLIVKRTVDGVTRRYVEYMERPWRRGDSQASQLYMDSALTYDGAPTTTVSGLDHLEGMTVDVLTDGAPHPQRTVAAGAIELQRAYSIVNVGLPAPCKLKTMRMEAGAQDGTAQGKTKRMHRMVFRLLDTGGGKVGPDDDHLDWLLYGQGQPMDQPAALFTGDKVVGWPAGYDTDAYVMYVNAQPLAATLEGVYPQIVTQDAR